MWKLLGIGFLMLALVSVPVAAGQAQSFGSEPSFGERIIAQERGPLRIIAQEQGPRAGVLRAGSLGNHRADRRDGWWIRLA